MSLIVGIIVVAVGSKLGLSLEICAMITTMVTGFMVGQGLADIGKEKALIEFGDAK